MENLIADLAGWVAFLLLFIPASVLLFEVAMACAFEPPPIAPANRARPRLAVLMPAHDEALLIAATVTGVLRQLQAGDRLIVIADNCTDQTAALARAGGAEVIERTDAKRRGKGYALDFGVRHLESEPPELVVIVDADCELGSEALDRLAASSQRSGRPTQAMYLMNVAPNAGRMQRVAAFAWLVRNKARAIGAYALGLPVQLMGTGMAFPWPLIRDAKLASGHIVEDLKLGLDLARAGHPPQFCPQALVTSTFPESAEGVSTQRARWEHGHLSVILSEVPPLLFDGVRRMDRNLLWLALDLSVPPLALLALLIAVSWVPALVLDRNSEFQFLLSMVVLASFCFACAVLVAWMVFGRTLLSARDLALAAVYPLRKIPLYLRFLIARQSKWVRSKRDRDSH